MNYKYTKLNEKDIELAHKSYEILNARGEITSPETKNEKKLKFKETDKQKKSEKPTNTASFVLVKTGGSAEIPLPPQAVEILTKVLKQMAKGKEVAVTRQPIEMTTQKAAEYLRVSRPFLIGLLEKGDIPFRKVGAHRRILFSDLQSYKEEIDAKRHKSLDALTEQAQELNMGY